MRTCVFIFPVLCSFHCVEQTVQISQSDPVSPAISLSTQGSLTMEFSHQDWCSHFFFIKLTKRMRALCLPVAFPSPGNSRGQKSSGILTSKPSFQRPASLGIKHLSVGRLIFKERAKWQGTFKIALSSECNRQQAGGHHQSPHLLRLTSLEEQVEDLFLESEKIADLTPPSLCSKWPSSTTKSNSLLNEAPQGPDH